MCIRRCEMPGYFIIWCVCLGRESHHGYGSHLTESENLKSLHQLCRNQQKVCRKFLLWGSVFIMTCYDKNQSYSLETNSIHLYTILNIINQWLQIIHINQITVKNCNSVRVATTQDVNPQTALGSLGHQGLNMASPVSS